MISPLRMFLAHALAINTDTTLEPGKHLLPAGLFHSHFHPCKREVTCLIHMRTKNVNWIGAAPLCVPSIRGVTLSERHCDHPRVDRRVQIYRRFHLAGF